MPGMVWLLEFFEFQNCRIVVQGYLVVGSLSLRCIESLESLSLTSMEAYDSIRPY
jgi:hypothetical protein